MKKTLLFTLFLFCSLLIPLSLSAVGTTVFINEIHYDNSGTSDVDEGFEIAGPAGTDLTGWKVELINLTGGAVYNTIDLSGTIADDGSGYGAIWFGLPTNGLQNGPQDGLVLINASSSVIHFLSYEGVVTATGGAATGMTSTDIGVEESNTTTAPGMSMNLSGKGTIYEDFTWETEVAATPNAVNSSQVFSSELDSLANIISFVLNEQSSPAVIDSAAATVTIVVALDTQMDSLFPTITISDGAMIDPASGDSVDFSTGSAVFTVTAENGIKTRDWTVTVTEQLTPSSGKEILGFVLASETKDAVIDSAARTVTAEVAYGTALTALAPTITVSGNATVLPASDSAQDFSAGAVSYTVTAQDLTTSVWAVTVTAVTPVEVADMGALRAGNTTTLYKVTGEIILTFQQDYRNKKYVQDANGGVEIDDDPGKITTTYAVGDGITGLVGTLYDYFGYLQFNPIADPGAATSAANTITPQTITIAEFKTNFENYESEVVRIDTVGFAAGGGKFANNVAYKVGHGTDTTIVRTHFYDAGLSGTDIPAVANVTGIAIWDWSESKIAPRGTADIVKVENAVSVDDLLSNSMIKLYPNPSSGIVTFEMKRDGISNLDVEIISMNGKMVYRNEYKSVSDVREQIDLSNVSRGLYILRVRSSDAISIQKLVIK